MGDLRREIVALDPVRVVQEVERVVDRQSEPGAPRHEALVDLGRDADLGDFLKDLGRDGEQPDEGRSRTRPEHDLQAPLEGEHLGIEARARDHVGQEILDVVEGAGLGHRVREVEDLLLEQELLFVIEHGSDGSSSPVGRDRSGAGRRAHPDHRAPVEQGLLAASNEPRPQDPRQSLRARAAPFGRRTGRIQVRRPARGVAGGRNEHRLLAPGRHARANEGRPARTR